MAFDFGGALTSAGKGAAAGAVFGPVGAAAGGLLGMGLQIAPEIGKWLGGDKGNEVASQVRDVVQQVAGTSDPDVVPGVLAEDPRKVSDIRVRLAQIAADREEERRHYDLETMKQEILSQQGAREMGVALAREHHPLAYGAAVVTVFLMGLFVYVVVANPPMDEGVKETLKVLTVAAASYWIGSSRGSASKDVATRNVDAPTRG